MSILFLIVLIVLGGAAFYGAKTIHDLLGENKILKQAIATLTHEDQIGYAKVLRQETRDGKTFTTLKFVETVRGDKLTKVLEKEYTIEGDVVHFDALIVTFSDRAVMDGKERSLYLWRRVYGDTMSPSRGFAIDAKCTPKGAGGDVDAVSEVGRQRDDRISHGLSLSGSSCVPNI